ncbi:MAG: hypothetical protein ABIX28_18190 [Vicinamibacterales bacterium]
MSSIDSLAPEPIDPVRVSPMEEAFWRGPMRVVMLLRLDGWIESAPLVEALRRQQRRHPKLRAVMAVGPDGRNIYQFQHDPPAFPCEVIDVDGAESPWREATERLLHIDPPPRGSLMAVIALRDRARQRSEVVLSVHHGVADGRSGVTLAHELLTEYVNAHTGRPPLPALPVVSAPTARLSSRWIDRLRLVRRFVRLQLDEARLPHTRLPEAPGVLLSSQWVHWVLSREDTLKLVRCCRTHRVIPTAAVVAAVCCGLMECLPATTAVLKWQCPFDVRESVDGPVSPVDLGNFVASMRGLCALPRRPSFWEVAKQVHQDIQEFVRQGGPALGYNIAQLLLGRRFRRLDGALPRPMRRPTLLFTNHGVIGLADSYGDLRLQEATFIFKGDDVTRPWLTLESLIVGHRLNLGLIGDGLDPAFWARLHVAVRGHLDLAMGLGAAPAP